MTATATVNPPCPKCQGEVWDQHQSKFWGNGLTKNGKKKPRWECKNKECGGAVWEKDTPAAAPARQPNPSYTPPNAPQMPPGLEEPEWLQGHGQEVAANVQNIIENQEPHFLPSELAAKRGLRFIKQVLVPALPVELQDDPLVWSQLMRTLNGLIVANERYYQSPK